MLEHPIESHRATGGWINELRHVSSPRLETDLRPFVKILIRSSITPYCKVSNVAHAYFRFGSAKSNEYKTKSCPVSVMKLQNKNKGFYLRTPSLYEMKNIKSKCMSYLQPWYRILLLHSNTKLYFYFQRSSQPAAGRFEKRLPELNDVPS